MPNFDGVVTIAEDDFPVVVELDDDLIRLTSSGSEIGQWHPDECEITQIGESTYTIKAENEVLEFVPTQPGLFAAALNGDPHLKVAAPLEAGTGPPSADDDPLSDEPPPKPLTMGLFYALCVATAALALWSLISMIL